MLQIQMNDAKTVITIRVEASRSHSIISEHGAKHHPALSVSVLFHLALFSHITTQTFRTFFKQINSKQIEQVKLC